jgi:hypothetical protein
MIRNPARTPARACSDSLDAATTGDVSARTSDDASATARNVAPSIATTASSPPKATAMPPSGEPINLARLRLVDCAALATVS